MEIISSKIWLLILSAFFALLVSCGGDDPIEVDCSSLELSVSIENCEEGELLASAIGGKEPYQFSLDDMTNEEGEFSGLSSGTYSVKVMDANGCETSREVVLNPTLSLDVMSVINLKCSRSGCHLDTQEPLLNSESAIISAAPRILNQISTGAMPPNGNITSQESKTLIAWINCGAKDN